MGDASFFRISPWGCFWRLKGRQPLFCVRGRLPSVRSIRFLLIPSAAYRRQRQFTELWAIDIAFDAERDMALLI